MTTVLVEGESDRVALQTIARRLQLAPPTIVAMGGAHAIARVVADIRRTSPGERLIGLVDESERRSFERVVGPVYVCVRDLEDELIRALGVNGALDVIDMQGEIGSFRTLQKQPAQRDRNHTDQIRRFLHGRSGNKARYAALFAAAIDLDRIPQPLRDVLATATES